MEIIKLNIIPSGVNPTCHASQYDEGRVIRVELFEGLTPFTLQASDEIGLAIRKPDDKIVTMLVENTEDNYVDIVTTKQACAVVGANLCELTIKRSSVVIGTLNFYMQVERDPLADGDDSESEIRDLQERVNACVEIALEDLYDGTSVLFDAEPVLDHDEPYTVTSNGIAQAFDAVNTALEGKVDNSALTANYYNKTQVDNALDSKANTTDLDYFYTKLETYSKNEVDNAFSSLATVAATGSYNDLINKPTIPAAQVNSDWNATSGVAAILNKPTVAANASELPYESGSQDSTKNVIDQKVRKGTYSGFTLTDAVFTNESPTNRLFQINLECQSTGLPYTKVNLEFSPSGFKCAGYANNVWTEFWNYNKIDTYNHSAALKEGETVQIPQDVLNHKLILIRIWRYGYFGSILLDRADIVDGHASAGVYVFVYTGSKHFTISSSGVITAGTGFGTDGQWVGFIGIG